MWSVHGQRSGGKAVVWSPSESFTTKREAVTAMMSRREPKTPIFRVGHTYVFQEQKNT